MSSMSSTCVRPETHRRILSHTEERARVLHVVDPLDDNISCALSEYLAATPQLEHWLLVGWESCTPLRLSSGSHPAEIMSLPSGHRSRLHAIVDCYNTVNPTWVHAHSFSAGAYVRLALSIPTDRIIYSPHSYAFERRDLAKMARLLNVAWEYVMAPRSSAVAVCNPREAHLAARLHRTGKIVRVPHLPRSDARKPPELPSHSSTGPTAVAMGPLNPQRDPSFFEAVVTAAESDISWIWIGDGEPRYKRLLEKAGVCVTGRLPRSNRLRLLRTADVYVHTAAWEGSYDTLMQAAAAGLPIAARAIPALKALRLPGLAPTPRALAATVQRILASPEDRRLHSESSSRVLRAYTCETQAARLRELYASG